MITYIPEDTAPLTVTAFYSLSLFVALTQTSPGQWTGDLPPGTPARAYLLTVKEDGAAKAYAEYFWDGEKEVNALTIDPSVISRIDSNTKKARQMLTNSIDTNITNATFTTLSDDESEIVSQMQTFNAAGQPSVVRPVRRRKIQ